MNDKPTRTFTNFHHPEITDKDYGGIRVLLDNRFKLILTSRNGKIAKELYDVRQDPAETTDLVASKPQVVKEMSEQLRDWQESVLHSLAGADYE